MNTVFQLKEKKILAIFSWFRFYWIKSNTFNCQVTFGPYSFTYFLTFRFCFPVFWISTSYPQYSLYNICKSLDGKREESLPALTAPSEGMLASQTCYQQLFPNLCTW